MAKEVFMPKTGMDMHEGTILRWLFNVGDYVRAGEPLLEIETDKVTMEVEAPADGVLLCKYFEEGAVVPVVTIIAYIGREGEQVPDRPAMAGGTLRTGELSQYAESEQREKTRDYEYRAAVIGGGPAGYTAALRAAKCGKKVILFEKDRIGGTGINCGSIPMKTYMRTARLISDLEMAESRGIMIGTDRPKVDPAVVKSSAAEVVAVMRNHIEELLRDAGVELVREEAAMIGRHHIRAGGRTYRAENTIICCGSGARTVDVPGADLPGILDPEQMFELETFPERLVIIGGGVIGCEMAAAFSRFGTFVTIIENQDALVPTFDPDVSREIRLSFENHGIRVMTGERVARFETRDSFPSVLLENGEEVSADIILLAVGRQPSLASLGVLKNEIDYERGKIMVDEYCRTNLDNIYACGDVTNRSILAHSAIKMGDAAASTACGIPKEVKLMRAPLCLYTVPEAAGIGLTEPQAARQGEIMVGKYPFSLNGRAVASGETEGFVKVIADKSYGEILGVHVVGAMATEMIVEAKTMMDMEITVYEVADIMHPHPTWSEAFMEACAAAIGDSLKGTGFHRTEFFRGAL